nr:T9SS type A sorting domain-containing protein [Gracilimonas tropica]
MSDGDSFRDKNWNNVTDAKASYWLTQPSSNFNFDQVKFLTSGDFYSPIFHVSNSQPKNTSNAIDFETPLQFNLSQNYPNPFNPITHIQYGLPASGFVKLEVFNIKGQKVATLLDERKSAGLHKVTFDASNLASGLYIYRIQAGNHVETKRFILIK